MPYRAQGFRSRELLIYGGFGSGPSDPKFSEFELFPTLRTGSNPKLKLYMCLNVSTIL